MNNSDRVYKELLQKSLSTLKRSIDILSRKNDGLTDRRPVKIEGLRLQYEQIEQELKNFEARKEFSERKEKMLEHLDEKAEKIVAKKESHEEKIQELENLRKKLKTVRGTRKIDKKIEHQHKIIRRLQKKNARIDFRQKVIMLPKYYRIQKRDNLLNKQQGRVNLVSDKLLINERLQSQLDPEHSIIDRMKSAIYDIKGKYYERKLGRREEILKAMQEKNSIVGMLGARVTALPKSAIDKLRRRNKKEETIDQTRKQEPQPVQEQEAQQERKSQPAPEEQPQQVQQPEPQQEEVVQPEKAQEVETPSYDDGLYHLKKGEIIQDFPSKPKTEDSGLNDMMNDYNAQAGKQAMQAGNTQTK